MKSALLSKFSLEWRGIFLISLPTVLIIPAAEVATDSPEFWPLVVANLASLLVAVVFIALASRIPGIRSSWVFVLLAGGLAGLMKGGITWWLSSLWQIEQPALWSRMVFGFASWVVLIALMASIQQSIGQSNDSRELIIARLKGAQKQFSSLEEQRDWLVKTKLEGMEKDLAKEFVELLSQLNSEGRGPEAIRDVAQKLRQVARGKVRDVSFANWSQKQAKTNLLQLLISAKPNPLIFSLLFGFPAIANTLRTDGGLLAIAAIAFGTFAAVIWLSVSKLRLGHLLTPVIVVASEVASHIAFAAQLEWANVVSLFTWSVIALFLASSVELVRLRNERLKELAESDLKTTESEIEWLSLQLETTNIEIAKYLHSVVQTRLMSHALLVEQGAFDDQARDRLVEILTRPLSDFEPKYHDLSSALADLQSEWGTMVKVQIQTNCSDSIAIAETALVIREAIANAVHHGDATEVSVSVSDLQNIRTIAVTDNGKGLTDGSPGLGTQTYQALSQSWNLVPAEGGGSSLTVTLRLA